MKQSLQRALHLAVGFTSEVAAEIRRHVVKLTVGIISVGLVLLLGPVWTEVKRAWTNIDNISTDRALALARQVVGARVQIAIPFRNVGNPNQLIATWVTSDAARHDPCITSLDDDEDELPFYDEQACPWGSGTAQAILLVGNGDTYQEYPTGTYAFNIASPPPEVGEAFSAADYHEYFGVTDWNGDGIMEILSIAAHAGPSVPIHVYRVTLFDTGTYKSVQLEVQSDRNRTIQKLRPTEAENASRAWLNDRWREFLKYYSSEECERDLSGKLTCILIKDEWDSPLSQENEQIFVLAGKLHQNWLEQNGSTFSIGKIKLNFLPGEIAETEENGYCEIEDGDVSFVNAFKGPLFVVDRKKKLSSALYVIDGGHYREIPNVIVGREYVWLSLAQHDDLIAIRKATYETVLVDVAEWADGIPANAVPTFEAQEDEDTDDESPEVSGFPASYRTVKDVPISTVVLEDGSLTLNGEPLSLSIDDVKINSAIEFEDAAQCYSAEYP
ncbi:hypothetical protein RHAB21_00819 [Pseudorhizobium halotolerans]|uniref:Uncharacterized protein n=1 Tax=Pseudorhizobium halotolerans TaxID=1233081 RepID=A0ABM8PZ83_9HYPH|nr:hypothetical protein [Pseudorhizobium halotolerans]CAD7055909.1 hypothetical protein RHAB21_00819 [Pseudorhizobium halotolerans]